MGRYKEFLQGRCACHFHEVTQLYLSANEVLPMVRAAGFTADVLLCFLRWRSFGPQNFPVTERPPRTRPEQRELYIRSAANQPCQTRSRRRGLNPQPIVLEDQWTKYTLRSFWAACVPLPETEHLGGARWILQESHLSPSRTWTSERGGGLNGGGGLFRMNRSLTVQLRSTNPTRRWGSQTQLLASNKQRLLEISLSWFLLLADV